MKKKFIFLFIIILLFSCSKIPVVNKNNNLPEINYVIIPYIKEDNYIFNEGIPVDLTKDDITNIENILQIIIDEYNEKRKINPHPISWMNKELDLSQYLRQYVPVLNKNGEKEVFVNCISFNAFNTFNSNIKEIWNTELILTMDGGSAFFSIKINLNNKTYSDFFINGHL
jgi:hypothetical protein